MIKIQQSLKRARAQRSIHPKRRNRSKNPRRKQSLSRLMVMQTDQPIQRRSLIKKRELHLLIQIKLRKKSTLSQRHRLTKQTRPKMKSHRIPKNQENLQHRQSLKNQQSPKNLSLLPTVTMLSRLEPARTRSHHRYWRKESSISSSEDASILTIPRMSRTYNALSLFCDQFLTMPRLAKVLLAMIKIVA